VPPRPLAAADANTRKRNRKIFGALLLGTLEVRPREARASLTLAVLPCAARAARAMPRSACLQCAELFFMHSELGCAWGFATVNLPAARDWHVRASEVHCQCQSRIHAGMPPLEALLLPLVS